MALTAKRQHTAAPPPPDWAHAETIFAQIPSAERRDRVLFRLMFTCRLKAFEGLLRTWREFTTFWKYVTHWFFCPLPQNVALNR